MKENIKLGLILFVFTATAGLLLGLVHEITKEPIARQEALSRSAVGEVLPAAKSVKKAEVTIPEGSVVQEINEAYDGDKLVGHTMRIISKGFHGPIEFVIGITADDKIEGMKILSHTETAGLGANIEKDSFRGQFKGKSIEKDIEVVKGGGASGDNQIDAITGATISSNGVTNGINEALKFYRTAIKGEKAAPEKTKESLVKEILPDSDKLEKSEAQIPDGTSIKEIDNVYQGDKQVAYAFKVAPQGFGGEVETIAVISMDGKLEGIRILKHSETPGLGANAEKESFWSQFTGKSTDSPIEVDAMSGATITSKAVIKGVNEAADFYRSSLSGKGGQK